MSEKAKNKSGAYKNWLYFNRVILRGRVSMDPVIRENKESGKHFVACRLGVRRGTYANAPFDNFDLRASGKVGDSMLAEVHEGDYIIVRGPVSATAFIKDGKAAPNIQVTVFNWEMEQMSGIMKEVEEELAKGTTAEEFENDDGNFW